MFLTLQAPLGLPVIPEPSAQSSVSISTSTSSHDPSRGSPAVPVLDSELFKGRGCVVIISVSLATSKAPSLIQHVFMACLRFMPGAVWPWPAPREPTAPCRGPSRGTVLGACSLDVKGMCVCYGCMSPQTNLMRRASFPHFIDKITKISKVENDVVRGRRVANGQ